MPALVGPDVLRSKRPTGVSSLPLRIASRIDAARCEAQANEGLALCKLFGYLPLTNSDSSIIAKSRYLMPIGSYQAYADLSSTRVID